MEALGQTDAELDVLADLGDDGEEDGARIGGAAAFVPVEVVRSEVEAPLVRGMGQEEQEAVAHRQERGHRLFVGAEGVQGVADGLLGAAGGGGGQVLVEPLYALSDCLGGAAVGGGEGLRRFAGGEAGEDFRIGKGELAFPGHIPVMAAARFKLESLGKGESASGSWRSNRSRRRFMLAGFLPGF